MSKIDQIKIGGTTYDLPSKAQNISYSGDVEGADNVKEALDALAGGGGGSGKTVDIIVAASDSADFKKAVADYVCDGTNDETEINAAINAAMEKGVSVKLMKGTYYLDAASQSYSGLSGAFLLIDTSPPSGSTSSRGVTIYGEDAFNSATLRVSDAAYEGLNASNTYAVVGVYDSTDYGGYVELRNLRVRIPWNQKKIIGIEMLKYGGWARLHSVRVTNYVSGYNGTTVSLVSPPPVAAEGSIGIRFIGKGPNGAYGSDMTNVSVSGFDEGISINTEWTVCTHVCPIWCNTGWTFGHYYGGNTKSSTHPIVLICCGDERNVNLPHFYKPAHNIPSLDWKQDIEMIAFSIERAAGSTPGGVLGSLAVEETGANYRGFINYCTGQGSGNSVNIGFWEYGHGHGVRTTDMTHTQAGALSVTSGYHCNYLQRFYDTASGKMLVCVDEQYHTWKDAMGNSVTP